MGAGAAALAGESDLMRHLDCNMVTGNAQHEPARQPHSKEELRDGKERYRYVPCPTLHGCFAGRHRLSRLATLTRRAKWKHPPF